MTAATATETTGAVPTRRIRPISRATWVDLAVLTALSALAIAGFEPAFGPYNYLAAAVGGLFVGTAVIVVTYLLRLSLVPSIAIALAAYVLFGGAIAMPASSIAGVVPTTTTLLGVFQGAVYGWPDIVTLQTPVEAPAYIAVVPYFAAWLVSVIAVSIALRWLPKRKRTALRAGALVIPAIVLFLVGILIGTDQPYFAGIRGVVFAGVALVWLGWRRRDGAVSLMVDGSARRRKVVGVAVVVLGAVVIGAAGGILLAPKPASRFVLRQEITPPFDPLQYPSPLAGFRNFTKKEAKTDLFTVTGLESGQRIRMATMDTYDGIVWSVASPSTRTSDSGGFELLGRNLPNPPLAGPGSTSKLTFTMEGYNDVWLPDASYPTILDFDKYTGTDPSTTVRVNPVTSTVAVTSGVKKGLVYSVDVTTPTIPSDKALATVPAAKLTLPPVSNVPDVVAAKATEYAGTAKTTIQQLRNIERSLKTIGYLSHGLASDPVPSRAGEGADRITELFTKQPMVGDEEQYATAFALMARTLGYPTRVVMGFAPKVSKGDSVTTVTGKDVTAWDEVAFKGVGWVPFYPTPTKTDAPKDETTKPKIEPQPQVRQPPTTNQKQDQVLTPVKISNKNPKAKAPGFELPPWAYVVGGIILVPLVIILIPFLLIATLKAGRRRRRLTTGSPDRRAAGAWDELRDRYGELGLELPDRATRLQTAHVIDDQTIAQNLSRPDGGFVPLANRVDVAVFAGQDVEQSTVDALWSDADAATENSRASAGRLRRIIAAYRYRRQRSAAAKKSRTPARGTTAAVAKL
ncbi:MAG: transglutaminase protein [Microbacteriaceae bacterium]|nr:transglutaminase protein [Microbacteriaceae bacterium]